MLVGLAGALSGFNGSFDFPSGVTYPDHVPFHAMRIMLALPGVAMVPLAWGTAVELRFSKWGRHIVTVMVLTGAAALLVSLSPPLDFPVPDFGGAILTFLLGLGTRGRPRMARYLAVHPARLAPPLLHVHDRLLPRLLQQPAKEVSLLHLTALESSPGQACGFGRRRDVDPPEFGGD